MKKIRQYFALALCLLTLCSCAQPHAQPDDMGAAQISEDTDQPSEPAPGQPAESQTPDQPSEPSAPDEPAGSDQPSAADEPSAPQAPDTSQEQAQTNQPSEPESQEPAENSEPVVSISIRCDTVLNNLDSLADGVEQIIPADGVILAQTELPWTEGESVFDLLSRVARDNGVHMEYSSTPIYQSAYIEGIGNLYELDCGPLSGWMYRVNGVFPNYGCSNYVLEAGDVVEWIYTCDLGADVGGADSFAGQKE